MRPRGHWITRLRATATSRRSGFVRNERGAVAVEFAVLALPFFALIYAILETSLIFLAGQILDSAVNDASRKVRTGQAQSQGWGISQFRDAMCPGLYGLFDCDGLRIRVSVVTNFENATVEIQNPVSDECTPTADEDECDWTIAEGFAPGEASQVVLVQAYYKWPTILNFPGLTFGNVAGGKRILSGVRVFMNEPF